MLGKKKNNEYNQLLYEFNELKAKYNEKCDEIELEKKKSETVSNMSRVGIFSMDFDEHGSIISSSCSDKLLSLLNISSNQIKNFNDLKKFIYNDDFDVFNSRYESVLASKSNRQDFFIELRLKQNHGDLIWVECVGNLLRNSSGVHHGQFGFDDLVIVVIEIVIDAAQFVMGGAPVVVGSRGEVAIGVVGIFDIVGDEGAGVHNLPANHFGELALFVVKDGVDVGAVAHRGFEGHIHIDSDEAEVVVVAEGDVFDGVGRIVGRHFEMVVGLGSHLFDLVDQTGLRVAVIGGASLSRQNQEGGYEEGQKVFHWDAI